jgi:hypothetical protein
MTGAIEIIGVTIPDFGLGGHKWLKYVIQWL